MWQEFSPLARETGAVNLGLGFPNWPAPAFVKEAACRAIMDDLNQVCATVTRTCAQLRASWPHASRPCGALAVLTVSWSPATGRGGRQAVSVRHTGRPRQLRRRSADRRRMLFPHADGRYSSKLGRSVNPMDEVTVGVGACECVFACLQAHVNPGVLRHRPRPCPPRAAPLPA